MNGWVSYQYVSKVSVEVYLVFKGVNLTVQDLLRHDSRVQDLYSISLTSLFSVQIMSYLGVSNMIYSDVVDSLISEILKYYTIPGSLRPGAKDPGP